MPSIFLAALWEAGSFYFKDENARAQGWKALCPMSPRQPMAVEARTVATNSTLIVPLATSAPAQPHPSMPQGERNGGRPKIKNTNTNPVCNLINTKGRHNWEDVSRQNPCGFVPCLQLYLSRCSLGHWTPNKS